MSASHPNPTPAENGEACSAAGLWLVMMKAYRSMQMYVEATLVSGNVGLTDFMILEALLHKGSMSMSAIGSKVVLANPSITAAVARLEQLHYVTRQGDSVDRRVRTVALTPKGRKLIQKMFDQHQRDLEAVMVGVPAEQRAQLRMALKCIGMAAKGSLEATGKLPTPK